MPCPSRDLAAAAFASSPPLGPGSGASIAARLWRSTGGALGKAVVVRGRPGGDSIVGISAFVGTMTITLLFTPSSTFTAHPFLHDKLPTTTPISPIARVSNTMVAIVAPAAMKVGSLIDCSRSARASPANSIGRPRPASAISCSRRS